MGITHFLTDPSASERQEGGKSTRVCLWRRQECQCCRGVEQGGCLGGGQGGHGEMWPHGRLLCWQGWACVQAQSGSPENMWLLLLLSPMLPNLHGGLWCGFSSFWQPGALCSFVLWLDLRSTAPSTAYHMLCSSPWSSPVAHALSPFPYFVHCLVCDLLAQNTLQFAWLLTARM